jgi:hypothetical protein
MILRGAIRHGPYSLVALSLPQVHLEEYGLHGFLMSTKSFKRRVEPLEHVVHPEGHVAQGKPIGVSGNLGAPSAS